MKEESSRKINKSHTFPHVLGGSNLVASDFWYSSPTGMFADKFRAALVGESKWKSTCISEVFGLTSK